MVNIIVTLLTCILCPAAASTPPAPGSGYHADMLSTITMNIITLKLEYFSTCALHHSMYTTVSLTIQARDLIHHLNEKKRTISFMSAAGS